MGAGDGLVLTAHYAILLKTASLITGPVDSELCGQISTGRQTSTNRDDLVLASCACLHASLCPGRGLRRNRLCQKGIGCRLAYGLLAYGWLLRRGGRGAAVRTGFTGNCPDIRRISQRWCGGND